MLFIKERTIVLSLPYKTNKQNAVIQPNIGSKTESVSMRPKDFDRTLKPYMPPSGMSDICTLEMKCFAGKRFMECIKYGLHSNLW